ncbi:hypothetical protein JB92DRAFT_2934858 [Gautieria morchelliformis]|nr:hypothetical protein JB92DRAFT_2934858 [Gautieria morchelliformis]
MTKSFPPAGLNTSTPQVTSLLQTLRGEAFRRQRNLRGGHVSAPPSLARGPSLPPLFTSEREDEDANNVSSRSETQSAGPRPPRSWVPSSHAPSAASWQWRSHALSLTLHHTPSLSPTLYPHTTSRVPSLLQLCLHTLVYEYGGLPPEYFSFVPRHILREYVRYSAVHAPSLLEEDLDALLAIDNVTSVDGELIIIGPYAESVLNRVSESSKGVPEDWESEPGEAELPPPLHTFIVLASSFRPSLMTLLPPTLTHLALLNVSHIPLRTLPALLPLLALLDLSFNSWLGPHFGKLVRLEWSKWTKLTLLGLRGCGICDADAWTLKKRINERRLTDVEIVSTE